MKKILLTISVFMAALTLSAQAPATFAYSFPVGGMGGTTGDEVYTALGLPFYKSVKGTSYELDHGVALALLVKETITDEVCQNVDYTENGFNIPAPHEVGESSFKKYEDHGHAKKYDLLKLLTLTVWPTFDVRDTTMFHGTLPTIPGSELQDGTDYQIVEGNNDINYSSSHGCDSLVHLFVLLCPTDVTDATNTYTTVVMNDRYCWTLENLKTTDIPEGEALAYGNNNANADTYGRLYTWFSAVGLPESSTTGPTPDANGFVKGICPTGWHIPTDKEMAALRTYGVPALNATTLWTGPGASLNTNSSGFTALPAGKFNAAKNRYEGLGTQTDWWSMTSSYNAATSTMTALATECIYYCDSPMEVTLDAKDAVSVRCVKDYVY